MSEKKRLPEEVELAKSQGKVHLFSNPPIVVHGNGIEHHCYSNPLVLVGHNRAVFMYVGKVYWETDVENPGLALHLVVTVKGIVEPSRNIEMKDHKYKEQLCIVM